MELCGAPLLSWLTVLQCSTTRNFLKRFAQNLLSCKSILTWNTFLETILMKHMKPKNHLIFNLAHLLRPTHLQKSLVLLSVQSVLCTVTRLRMSFTEFLKQTQGCKWTPLLANSFAWATKSHANFVSQHFECPLC